MNELDRLTARVAELQSHVNALCKDQQIQIDTRDEQLTAERAHADRLAEALMSVIRTVGLSGNNGSATLEDVKLIVDAISKSKESLAAHRERREGK